MCCKDDAIQSGRIGRSDTTMNGCNHDYTHDTSGTDSRREGDTCRHVEALTRQRAEEE